MKTQFGPALSLFVIAPLVAEYLLGSLPMAMIAILPIMAAMYGGAALLIREAARRTGRGWGTIALLGLAYGLIEEGLSDQSLFNPHYLHLRLLDYGWVDALGTGLPWLIYVLTIHVVWSICVPIGLAEALFPTRRERSWLGPIAIGIVALLCAGGLLATGGFTHKTEQFMASPVQLAGTVVVVIVAIVAAFLLPRRGAEPAEQAAPPAWQLFGVGLVAGLATMMCRYFGPSWGLPWAACVAAQLAIAGGFAWYMVHATGGRRWTAGMRVAVVTSGLAVYGLFGVPTDLALHGPADLLPHCAFILLFLVLAVVAIRKSRTAVVGDTVGMV